MSDLSIDTSRLTDVSYAKYCILHGCDVKIRCKIAAIHGADAIQRWESVDTTKYEFDDEEFSTAYDNGKQGAKDATGYNGGKSYRAVVDGVVYTGVYVAGKLVIKKGLKTLATTAIKVGAQKLTEEALKSAAKKAIQEAANKAAKKAAEKATVKAVKEATKEAVKEGFKGAGKGILTKLTGQAVAREAGKIAAKKTAEEMGKEGAKKLTEEASKEIMQEATEEAQKKISEGTGKSVGCILGCTIGLAEGLAYVAKKPNKEQVDAAKVLRDEQLPASQDDLDSAQEMMAEAGEEIFDLTEEAEEANQEANDEIEDKKTLMDYYKIQYKSLKAKVDNGQQLTPDEKALYKKLSPLMQGLADDITDANDVASDTVNDIYSDIENYQDVYDDSAELMAEVQAVTDYAESFDTTAQIMCYVEGAVQTYNAASSAKSSYEAFALANSGSWAFGATAWAYAFGVMGATGAALSATGAAEQFGWAGEVGQEIDIRKETQEMGNAAMDVYDEEIENFAGSLETIEDLEIEIPEEMDVPAETTIPEEGTDTTNGTNGDGSTDGVNGNTGNNGTAGTDSNNGSDGTSPGGIPNSKDPNYVNNMGTGSDWHEVASGNIRRDSDNDIVKDSNGRVVLLGEYCSAITSVTGAKEGEYFSKDDIPQILETLLGDPFDAKTIKKIKNGKKVDSEFTAKILGTKDQDERGEAQIDNTDKATEIARNVVNFYWPIFEQASKRGWVRG